MMIVLCASPRILMRTTGVINTILDAKNMKTRVVISQMCAMCDRTRGKYATNPTHALETKLNTLFLEFAKVEFPIHELRKLS